MTKEETIETIRNDLMRLFREESKRRDQRIEQEEQALDQRAKYLSYRESELHDLFVQRRSFRLQLLQVQSGLERMIETIEKCKQEEIRYETDIGVLKSENEKLQSEIKELREKLACANRDINTLVHLLNN
jgi:chromosome segregation ATPase